MRNVAIASLVSLVLGGAIFGGCSSSSGGGGKNTGGSSTGGSAGTLAGGAGGAGGTAATGGGKGGSGGGKGGSGGSGGSPAGSCEGACGSQSQDGCYCDAQCESQGDCCPDFKTVCKEVTMPPGCVVPGAFYMGCNPVTNEGCTGTGVACDLASGGSFVCFDPPNDVQPGGACDNKNGPYCIPKYHCAQQADAGAGTCTAFCCTDADCGGGTCKPFDANAGTLGLCEGGSGDGGGTGGAGGTDGGGTGGATDASTD